VALLLALVQGGARLVSTGNLSSTQADAVEYLRARGVEVFGAATTDEAVHDEDLRQVIAARPHLLLDNGGDLFMWYLADPYPELLGGTEETTSGRMRLRPLAARLGVPVLVINDSPIKQFAENRHAVGQSVLESYLRITNQMTNGRQVAVFGYGACGKGVAANFRNAYASVAVVEIDPVTRLEASLDGFAVPGRGEALRAADVVITVTGAESVITADDLDPPCVLAGEHEGHGGRGTSGPPGYIPGGGAAADRVSRHALRFWHAGRLAGEPAGRRRAAATPRGARVIHFDQEAPIPWAEGPNDEFIEASRRMAFGPGRSGRGRGRAGGPVRVRSRRSPAGGGHDVLPALAGLHSR
jgi:S-adenosyl-L-homocysteine hydrolase, NAD binding domain